MGNASGKTLSPPDSRLYVQDLCLQSTNDLRIVKQIGSGKLMKSYQCTLGKILIVVKVYVKTSDEDLTKYKEVLDYILMQLRPDICPNVLSLQYKYSRSSQTRGGFGVAYLFRQHFTANLFDRLHTRPFLTKIEKNWIMYQLMCSVEQCHSQSISHGDIKSENFMVTSWNWVILTDFAPYKPTFLPDDDPFDFHYFFETPQQRCYLAPERFISSESRDGQPVIDDKSSNSTEFGNYDQHGQNTNKNFVLFGKYMKWNPSVSQAMDVFSLGCVIGELYIDGGDFLDFPNLLRFRSSTKKDPFSSIPSINKIKDVAVRRCVNDMLQRDPHLRKSVSEYRTELEAQEFFPRYFSSFLFKFMEKIHKQTESPDERIVLICKNYGTAIEQLVGIHDEEWHQIFAKILERYPFYSSCEAYDNLNKNEKVSSPILTGSTRQSKIKSVKIDSSVDLKRFDLNALIEETKKLIESIENQMSNQSPAILQNKPESIPRLNLNSSEMEQKIQRELSPEINGAIIMIQLICSNMTTLRFPQTKILALQLLVRFGLYVDDDTRLQRLVPYILDAMRDEVFAVRTTAIRALRVILRFVKSFPPADAQIFPKYIFPELNRVLQESENEEIVKIAFAETLPTIVQSAKFFLDTNQARKQLKVLVSEDETSRQSRTQSGSAVTPLEIRDEAFLAHDFTSNEIQRNTRSASDQLFQNNGRKELPLTIIFNSEYDQELKKLLDKIVVWMRDLTGFNGSHSSQRHACTAVTKRVLLSGIPQLCAVFGSIGATQIIQFMITLLNDNNWEISCAFFEHIPACCAISGQISVQLVLPCIENALEDLEEYVIPTALRSLKSLIELGLISQHKILQEVKAICPLLLHPNSQITKEVISLFTIVANQLGSPLKYVLLLPLIRPYLKFNLLGLEITEDLLKEAVRNQLSRESYQQALTMVFLANNPNTNCPQNEEIKDDNQAIGKIRTQGELITRSSFLNFDDPDEQSKLQLMENYLKMLNVHMKKNTFSADVANNKQKSERKINDQTMGERKCTEPNKQMQYSSIWIPNSSLFISDELIKSFVPMDEKEIVLSDLILQSSEYHAIKTSNLGQFEAQITNILRQASDLARRNSLRVNDKNYRPDIERVFLQNRINALSIPRYFPRLGALVIPDQNDQTETNKTNQLKNDTKSKFFCNIATLREHTAAVNRIAVSSDGTFFVTSSSDGTSKIWSLNGLEQSVTISSKATYSNQQGKILDICICERSRSVISASSDGSVHIWRIDLAPNSIENSAISPPPVNQSPSISSNKIGSTLIKTINPSEGAIINVNHFTTDFESSVVFVSQKGNVHSWDLRQKEEPFSWKLSPELGYATSAVLSTSRNWMCVGTSRGFLALWETRCQMLLKLYRHSSYGPIHRLSTCGKFPSISGEFTPIFIAAGQNETGIWDISSGGKCVELFKSIEIGSFDRSEIVKCVPTLEKIDFSLHQSPSILPLSQMQPSLNELSHTTIIEPSVRAIMGRISKNSSFLITGGSDRYIRLWDLQKSNKCYNISGLSPGQPKSTFETVVDPDKELSTRIVICHDVSTPAQDSAPHSQLAVRTQRGIQNPSTNHQDTILDLKIVDKNHSMLLSSSYDGTVKVWC